MKSLITHFDGITSDGHGGYNLTGDQLSVGEQTEGGFFANIRRDKCGRFKRDAYWEPIQVPNQLITSGNSVDRKIVIGVYTAPNDDGVHGFVSVPA